MTKQVVFLTHMSRSGSTLLSKLLDQYKDISVGIEGYFPDNIVRKTPFVDSEDSLDKYLDLLYKDKRFQGWNLERESIRNSLLSLGFPLSYPCILLTSFKLYFGNSIGKVLVHKCGYYIEHVYQVKGEFPTSKFIHIIRDPRAILNSQINSGMSRDPLSLSLTYKKQYSLCMKYKSMDDFLLIQYEELVANPRKEMAVLLDFIGANSRETGIDNYYKKIPGELMYLHENIGKSAIIEERVLAWREELDEYNQILMQILCRKEIDGLELPIYKYRISPRKGIKLLFHSVRFFLRKIKRSTRKLLGFENL